MPWDLDSTQSVCYEEGFIKVWSIHKPPRSSVAGQFSEGSRLSGYCKKWVDVKYISECAMFVDLLTPWCVFSKCMQYDDKVDILGAMMGLLRTLKEIHVKKLSSKPLINGLLTLLL